MTLEALLIPDNLTDSDSDGIDGGTGCNFIVLEILEGQVYLNFCIVQGFYPVFLQHTV